MADKYIYDNNNQYQGRISDTPPPNGCLALIAAGIVIGTIVAIVDMFTGFIEKTIAWLTIAFNIALSLALIYALFLFVSKLCIKRQDGRLKLTAIGVYSVSSVVLLGLTTILIFRVMLPSNEIGDPQDFYSVNHCSCFEYYTENYDADELWKFTDYFFLKLQNQPFLMLLPKQ